MNNCLSIITNFGCHYKCPYCIVKENNINVPETTLEGLCGLKTAIKETESRIISISGGGDPLHNYEQHVDWYRKLFKIANTFKSSIGYIEPIPIEIHTSYLTDETTFPFYDCHCVVYHANTYEQLSHIQRTGSEIVRVVFVVTEDFTIEKIMDIAKFVSTSNEIDELSFRQLVGKDYQVSHHLEDYLRLGHKKLWWYIEQCDYNMYYVENKVYDEYRKIGGNESD